MADSPHPDAIRRIILDHLPPGTSLQQLQDGWPLGEGGAGLDSIDLVEMLLVCEERFDVKIIDDLLAGGPVDVGAVVRAVVRAAQGRTP